MTLLRQVKIEGATSGNVAEVTSNNGLVVSLEELSAVVSSNGATQLNVTRFDSSGNETPAMDTVGRPGFQKITDGTSTVGVANSSQLKTSLFDIDGTDANVATMTNDDHNIDGMNGLLTASSIYGRIDNASVKPLKMDAVTHSLQVISYPHHEIHAGNMYKVRSYVDLAINNVADIQITTPNTLKWGHIAIFFETENETNWWLYENVTINLAGTNKPARNLNRNSVNTAAVNVDVITNTSLALADTDTAIASADLLEDGISGSGKKEGGESANRIEWILKQNTEYTLRFEASTAGFTNYYLEWYEHTSKD